MRLMTNKRKEGYETEGTGEDENPTHGTEYEGVPSANALGMAFFESSGMRSLIDKKCNYDPEKRILSPRMVVKAMIGPTFNITHKFPLCKVETAYSSTPSDRLFGVGVTKDDFILT